MTQRKALSRRAFLKAFGGMSGAALVLAACGGTSSTGNAPAGTAATAAEPTSQGRTTVRFYGKIDEFTSTPEMIAALQEHFKDKFDIEMIKVDWGNLDTIIKTGILSNTPADIYFYWPGSMQSYVEADQALDLTPYLEANNGEWKKTFIPGNLELGKYGDKYFAVPDNQTGGAIYINDTLAQQLGVTIPDDMSWEQFVAVCEQIKSKGNGVFPFAIDSGLQSWLPRVGIMSLAKSAGLSEALAKGEVPATDPLFKTAIENAGALFKNGYVYPGEGALAVTGDELNAAFAQQKVVMIANVFTSAKSLADLAAENNFTIKTAMLPRMGEEKVVFGACNGWFIPSNAPRKDEAVEVLQYWLGKDLQSIQAEHGIIPSTTGVTLTDPAVAKLAEYGNYFGTTPEFTSLSQEISQYIDKDMLAEYVLGESVENIQNKLEALRQKALAAKTS